MVLISEDFFRVVFCSRFIEMRPMWNVFQLRCVADNFRHIACAIHCFHRMADGRFHVAMDQWCSRELIKIELTNIFRKIWPTIYIVQFSGNSVAKSRIQWKRETHKEWKHIVKLLWSDSERERDLWREKKQGTCFNCLFTFLLLWLNVRFGIEKPVSYAMYKMVQCHNPSEIFVIMCEIDETAIVVLRSRGFEVNAWMDFTVTQVRPLRENIRLRGKTFEREREKTASVHVFSIKQ